MFTCCGHRSLKAANSTRTNTQTQVNACALQNLDRTLGLSVNTCCAVVHFHSMLSSQCPVYINAPKPHLSFIHMIYTHIHRARQNAHTAIQQKGLCRLNGNYNSIQFKPRMNIQIRESDPVLVNKTQMVTKRNYSNNQKTTNRRHLDTTIFNPTNY